MAFQDLHAPPGNPVDFGLAVALGYFPRISYDTHFGYNPEVDTATVPEDVWAGGGLYTGQPTPGTAEKVEIISAAAADDRNGTGARTVEISGLDSDWLEASETLSTTGSGSSGPSVNTYRRVYRGKVLTAGSGAINAGVLECRHVTTTADIFFHMPAGSGRTLVGAVTVPAGKSMYVTGLHIALARIAGANTGSGIVSLRIRTPGSVYRSIRYEEITPGFAKDEDVSPPEVFTEMTDLVFRVETVSTNDTAFNTRLSYFLIPNT